MFSTNFTDEPLPTLIAAHKTAQASNPRADTDVGVVRHIDLRELQAHVASTHLLMQLARARHRGTHSPSDAAEAYQWAQAKEEAQAALLAARRAMLKDDELTMGGEWTCEIA